MLCLPLGAQSLKLKGIGHNNRYDDGDQMKSTYVGWNSELGKAVFIVDNGIYAMTYDGQSLSVPAKEPAVDIAQVRSDVEKQAWATNFNMMCGNSGAVYVDGKLVTVFSRDESSTTDDELFQVCKWDAVSGELLSKEKNKVDAYNAVIRQLEKNKTLRNALKNEAARGDLKDALKSLLAELEEAE
jgi:hypothetical protein